MTRRLSLFITIVGAALVLGVPTAGAASGPVRVPPMLASPDSTRGVYPDSYKRTVVVGRPDPRHASLVARHRALEAQRAPFPGSRGAPSTTVQEPRSAPGATSSSNEFAWSQIGVGFGIGIVLMVGLYLLVRVTRRRQLAGVMTNINPIFGLLIAVLAAAVGVVAFGATQASASSAPIVIPYEKTCDETVGHCVGTAGDGGTLEMQVTSFRATGKAAQLTLTEWITVGDISFTAEMNGHGPAGFTVLNGTVTEGLLAGVQIHQRSDLVSVDGTTTVWTGELRLMPASA